MESWLILYVALMVVIRHGEKTEHRFRTIVVRLELNFVILNNLIKTDSMCPEADWRSTFKPFQMPQYDNSFHSFHAFRDAPKWNRLNFWIKNNRQRSVWHTKCERWHGIGGLISRVDYGASFYVIFDFKIAHKKTWLFCGNRDNATNSFEFIIFQLESTRTHEHTRLLTRRRACIASLSGFSMFQ